MAKTSRDLKNPKGRTAMKTSADRKGPSSDLTGRKDKAALEDGDPSGSATVSTVAPPGLWAHWVHSQGPHISNSMWVAAPCGGQCGVQNIVRDPFQDAGFNVGDGLVPV